MVKIIWSPSALEDVNSIAEFIARDSVDRAALFVARLLEAIDRLQDYPRSGRVKLVINHAVKLCMVLIVLCIGLKVTIYGLLELYMVHAIGILRKTLVIKRLIRNNPVICWYLFNHGSRQISYYISNCWFSLVA